MTRVEARDPSISLLDDDLKQFRGAVAQLSALKPKVASAVFTFAGESLNLVSEVAAPALKFATPALECANFAYERIERIGEALSNLSKTG